MAEVTTVAETAVEAVAPVVAAGNLDTKQVLFGFAAGVGVMGLAYATYRIIKKRKAAKMPVVEINPEEALSELEAEAAK